MRLIDTDAISEKEMNYPVWVCLKKQPTVDAVPVVRCKECKFAAHRAVSVYPVIECRRPDSGGLREADDFCSYGEARE